MTLLILAVSLLPLHHSGCAPVLKGPLDDAAHSEAVPITLGHGYALLTQLLHDESDVTLIFGLKHAPEDVKALLSQVADTAASTRRELLALADDPPAVPMDTTGLPLIEVSARHALANSTAASLLLAGRSFEIQLLVSQEKACSYAAALCGALAVADVNRQRTALLEHAGKAFQGYASQISALIAAGYKPPRQDAH
ncbi:MAG: hypothetical protein MK077_09205 [Phycisphaerales bacterium]|nr:hypothetical protein [Phycisphaerales bacterium]